MIGYEYINKNGFVWRKHFGALIPLSMPHIEPKDQNEGIQEILKSTKTLFARWDRGFDCEKESMWWHVIKDREENILDLSGNTRSKVRRGSKKYKAALVKTDLIKSTGYQVYCDTFKSYSTIEKSLSRNTFEIAIDNLPSETEFWGIIEIEKNTLVGFSENIIRDQACFYSSIWVLPEAMKKYASYVLIHEMNKHYLNKMDCLYVSDGSRSISHDTGVHEFLQSKFGFRKAYSSLNIAYRPWFGILIWILFPLRALFNNMPSTLLRKMSILLFQEEIRRSCNKGEAS